MQKCPKPYRRRRQQQEAAVQPPSPLQPRLSLLDDFLLLCISSQSGRLQAGGTPLFQWQCAFALLCDLLLQKRIKLNAAGMVASASPASYTGNPLADQCVRQLQDSSKPVSPETLLRDLSGIGYFFAAPAMPQLAERGCKHLVDEGLLAYAGGSDAEGCYLLQQEGKQRRQALTEAMCLQLFAVKPEESPISVLLVAVYLVGRLHALLPDCSFYEVQWQAQEVLDSFRFASEKTAFTDFMRLLIAGVAA